MAPENSTAAAVAAILNCAWWIRYNRRPMMARSRRAAIQNMACIVARALQTAPDPEAILYAVATGLYDQADKRFQV